MHDLARVKKPGIVRFSLTQVCTTCRQHTKNKIATEYLFIYNQIVHRVQQSKKAKAKSKKTKQIIT